MLASLLSSIIPPFIAFWALFVVKTEQLFPGHKKLKAKRQLKQISSERVNAIGDAQSTSDGRASTGKELALPDDVKAPPVYEIYDHPAPPIPVLGASLPSAPLGYGWEIAIVSNEHGNPAMRLCLLNLRTTMEVGSIEADLIVLRRWKFAQPDTYASHYRKAEAISGTKVVSYETDHWGDRHRIVKNKDHTEMLGKVMMANLITPMVDWARMTTLRFITNNPDETKCNYLLIESGEKVEVPA